MKTETGSDRTSDLVYAAAYSGFVGSGSLALFFLLRDALLGTPLLTPSILGAAILGPGIAAFEPAVRLDWVALVSLVHVVLFMAVGGPFAILVHRLPALRERPLMLALGIFGTLGAGIVSLDMLLAPGLLAAIGPASVTVGNAVTAAAMTVFYQWAFADALVGSEART
ncbi:MAG: hypothetical protein R3253_00490 [Longimicrobiales bacterium]|nr:hypothetical protein [Longimicrobiales bacterium]